MAQIWYYEIEHFDSNDNYLVILIAVFLLQSVFDMRFGVR